VEGILFTMIGLIAVVALFVLSYLIITIRHEEKTGVMAHLQQGRHEFR